MRRFIVLPLFLFVHLIIFSKSFSDEILRNREEFLYFCPYINKDIYDLAKQIVDDNSYKKKWLLDYLSNFPAEKYPVFTAPSVGFFAIGNILDKIKKDIREKKIYKPHLTKALKKYTKENSLVLDIGANFGYHTLILSKALKNQGKVLAFESNPKRFRELFFNLFLNNIENSSIFLANITSIASEKNFNNENTSLNECKKNVLADQLFLDSLNLKNVSLIKIAVEQINIEAIDAMKCTLKENNPIIILDIPNKFEENPQLKDKILNIFNKLKCLNYNIKKLSENYDDYIALPFIGKVDNLCEAYNKKVLISILARNKAHVLDPYLKCIENLNYDKKKIGIYINTNNNIDNTKEILKEWMEKNEENYLFICFENNDFPIDLTNDPHKWTKQRFKVLGNIRNKSLQKTKEFNCNYYFVVDCDNFIIPSTLKDLIEKDKPIIAPMLRSIPETNDKYSNYFCSITASGYYKAHPIYYEILNRSIIGTFRVPVVHCTYLIKAEFIDQLNYIDNTDDHEFVIFSRTARKNKIEQYICNEKNFGYLLHWKDNNLSLKDEKDKTKHINVMNCEYFSKKID